LDESHRGGFTDGSLVLMVVDCVFMRKVPSVSKWADTRVRRRLYAQVNTREEEDGPVMVGYQWLENSKKW
jgi:hypothetical protein